jgi:N-acetylglucosaminyl-diphospho-decaprenol L-rhamnosyltransferase
MSDAASSHAPATGRSVFAGRRKIGVVVVSYNSSAELSRLLASLESNRDGHVAEVVVVDNGSEDASVKVARSTRGVEVVEQSNVGYAGGVNRGIAEIDPVLDVLVLNPDVELAPDAIDHLVAALDRESRVGIVVPLLRDTAGRIAPSLRREPSLLTTLAEAIVGGSRAGRLGERFAPDPALGLQQADWATGAAMLLRRSVLDDVGLFDERFFLYSEETEFCLRARDAGYVTVCEPAAEATHVGGQMKSDPALWSLRAVNRVRLVRQRHGRLRATAFRVSCWLFEFRRAVTGDPVSIAALRALSRPDLDRTAGVLVRLLRGLSA